MATYIAFLRAVNVGGRTVRMEVLRSHLSDAGFTDVETYIQTGNVRLRSPARSADKVERLVEQTLAAVLTFEVKVIVRTPAELTTMVEQAPDCPLAPDARHYLSLLRSAPSAEAVARIDGWDVDGERLCLVGKDVHIWLAKPTHQARISNARLEEMTGRDSTMRDWKVMTALAEKWG